MIKALAGDRYGIAIASLAYADPNCRALAIDSVSPTQESVMSRRYPLYRPVSLVLRRSPMTARVREYIEFLLSREGQQIIAEDGSYLPLPESIAREGRRKLE
jgi:phosphate transport system substrate-binding protein